MLLEFFPLNIFPVSSLASSVVTTVWIGVVVVVFFNLRLGWVLSGLVVPGYMVPLIILKPWAASVVFVEGIITYLIVWFLFEKLSRIGAWCSVFGRDRFFALILVSIAVRLGFDGWIWPEMGEWVNITFDINFDYRNNLQSFGLIVIALIANQFWKTGVWRGLIPMTVITLVVYLIIRFVLMEFTNFTISNVTYMYEDVAASILASPKSYIILLCVAMVASRMNLIYGWDFSGILIPSLLALQWYQPTKILATFIEAFVILFIANLLLRLEWFKNANIEAARKLLLFFNIAFAYKFLLAYLVLWFFPETKITDTYAFGYLLATLLALKMHDKDIAARMTRATLQTSLIGVALASAIGFGLTLLPDQYHRVGMPDTSNKDIATNSASLIHRLEQDKIRFYGTLGQQQPIALATELEAFTRALNVLKHYRLTKEPADLFQATELLSTLSYGLELLEERYIYISETEQMRGWGSYVIDLKSDDGLLVSVPRPLEEKGSLEAAEVIFKTSKAQAMAVAGTRSDTNSDQSSAVLVNGDTFFHAFHQVMDYNNSVQIRTYNNKLRRMMIQSGSSNIADNVDMAPTRIWVKSSLPKSLDLPFIRGRTNELSILWDASPLINRQREAAKEGFAEIFLNKTALRKLRAYQVFNDTDMTLQVEDQRIDGYLQEWILSGRQTIAAAGSDNYVKPSTQELLFFDEEVLTPLLTIMQTAYSEGQWSQEGREDIRLISAMASVMGYSLLQYRHRASKQDFVVLYEKKDSDITKHWGTYVFRLGQVNNYLVQVPRPLHEVNSFEYGVALFERLNSRLLSISGSDPDTNRDGSADLVRAKNMESLFSLVNQVVLRESGDLPMMIIHSRARGYRQDVSVAHEDALLAYNRHRLPATDPLSDAFLQTLRDDGLSFRYVDGSLETVGYEATSVSQSRYLSATQNKQFWVIWLSPLARSKFRQQSENKLEIGRFSALNVPTFEQDLLLFLRKGKFSKDLPLLPKGLFNEIQKYLASQNIIGLSNIVRNWNDYQFVRFIDRDSRQSFLLILDDKKQVLSVANLNPRELHKRVYINLENTLAFSVDKFIHQRAAWLLTREIL